MKRWKMMMVVPTVRFVDVPISSPVEGGKRVEFDSWFWGCETKIRIRRTRSRLFIYERRRSASASSRCPCVRTHAYDDEWRLTQKMRTAAAASVARGATWKTARFGAARGATTHVENRRNWHVQNSWFWHLQGCHVESSWFWQTMRRQVICPGASESWMSSMVQSSPKKLPFPALH